MASLHLAEIEGSEDFESVVAIARANTTAIIAPLDFNEPKLFQNSTFANNNIGITTNAPSGLINGVPYGQNPFGVFFEAGLVNASNLNVGTANGEVLGSSIYDPLSGISTAGGADTLYGGDANETLLGGAGDDQISGGNGDDYLHGGSGINFLYGGPGNDFITGDRRGLSWFDFNRVFYLSEISILY